MNKLSLYLFITTVLLAAIGIFVLYETSTYTALLNLKDKYYFVKNQTIWVILGIIVSLIISKINYKKLYILALPLLLVTIVLLFVVFIPGAGLELKGAHRWINLGFIVFQPSELLKITLTLYLAAWLSNKEKGRLPAFLILLLACVFLVVLEPDLGTAFIIGATSVIVYFLSGSSFRDIALIGIFAVVALFLFINLEPYRIARFSAFQNFDPNNLSTTSYHVKQMLIALGSGGISGVGFGNSIQKYLYLPESTTDSIFSIFAEEAGFIGSIILLGIYFIQLLLGFIIATRVTDKFGKLLAAGIIIFIGIQAIINLGSQVVLVPLAGIPLPFISYGGSSMLINFASIGLLLNISRYT